MKTKSSFLFVPGLALAAGVALAAGLAAQALNTAPSRPQWVAKGAGPYRAAAAPVFLGIGLGNPLANPRLRDAMADDRARRDLDYALRDAVRSLARSYMARHLGSFTSSDLAGAHEFSAAVSQRVAADLAPACAVVDHWKDPHTGVLYTLARFDADDRLYDRYKAALARTLVERHGASGSQAVLADLDKDIQGQRMFQDRLFGAKEGAPGLK